MIELNQVSKDYGQISALSDVSFTLEPGVIGLLGPNGAGKSTALRLVAGFLAPTAGTVRVMGKDPLRAATRDCIGYLPEGAPLLPDATVAEILDFHAGARRVPRHSRTHLLRTLLDRLSLSPLQHRIAETLSKGQRRRVALAAAVIGDPPILILDEPTDGLDPHQREDVHTLIRELAPSRTILISTHMLDEADHLCKRALIIAEGKLLADGAPHELASRSRHHGAVRISVSPEADAMLVAAEILKLPSVRQVESAAHSRHLIAVGDQGRSPFNEIAQLIAHQNVPVEELRLETGRLDEIFRSLTGPSKTP